MTRRHSGGRRTVAGWLRLLLPALFALVLVGQATPGQLAAQEGPRVTVSPGAAPAGATVTVSGKGFAAERAVQVRLGGDATIIARGDTGRTGSFSISITVPVLAPGTYPLSVEVDGAQIETSFTITMTASGERDRGGQGAVPSPTPSSTPAPCTGRTCSTPAPTPLPIATATPQRTPTPAPSATAAPCTSRGCPSPTATPTPTPAPTPGGTPTSARRVVGYFPIWLRNDGYSERDIDFSVVTHVAHFSVVARGDGTIEIPDWGPFPDSALLTRAHAAGAKVSLVVGGDDAAAADSFSQMAESGTTRAAFIRNLMALVNQHGYDGVDLDWEFPGSSEDRSNLTALVSELRTALGRDRTLSIAAPASDWHGQWFDLAGLLPNLDWVGAMTYALHAASWSAYAGHNAPLYPSAHITDPSWEADTSLDSTRAYYLARGVPPSKLLLGLPFFGTRFDGATDINVALTNDSGAAMTYDDIAPLIGNGWTARRDTTAQVPYLVKNTDTGVISYDDATSISAKCSYTTARGLGGVIIWHIGQDGPGQPLLRAARGCR